MAKKAGLGAKYHGPTDAFGFPIGTLDDNYDICMVVDLEEYYDEYGDFGFRPSRDVIDHPNGRGKVEKRVLQASLLQELRAFKLIVNVVRSRAGNKNYFLIRAPTVSEWARKVWVPKAVGESDCKAHIPRAQPRIFGEKCINVDRDKLLRDMGVPLVTTDARLSANPDVRIHEVQVLMSWYDYWSDKFKIKYLCRQHEKGFKNFYLPYEFNEKSFYEGEGEHNLIYSGALVTIEDLEDEIEHSGELRDVAGKMLTELRKAGKWWPPVRRYGASYILNPERIDEKAKWLTEGQITDAEAQLKLKSDLERFEEANELRRAEGKAELTKSLELRNRKVWQSQYEIYKEELLRMPWLKRGVLKDQDKWLEWLVLKNAMRATSVRAELLFRVIEEACKRKVIGKKADESLEAAADGSDLRQKDDKQAKLDQAKDAGVQGKPVEKAEVKLSRDLDAHEAAPGSDTVSSVDMYLTQLLQAKVIEAVFPLHHREARRWLIEHWARVPKRRLLFSKDFWLARAPTDEIRDYFGEEEAFYFAWLGLYTRMLYIPACVGLGVQLWNINNGSINDSVVVPFYCLFLALWSVSFNAAWKREEADLCHRWGMTASDDQELDEQLRPEFRGKAVTNPYTEGIEMVRTSGMLWGHLFKLFYLVSAAAVVSYALLVLSFRHTIKTAAGFPEEHIGAFFWFHLSIGLISTVAILLFDEIYSHVAIWFNNKENHRTDKDYDRALAVKLISFYLISANVTLLYTAFWGQVCRPRDQDDLDVIQASCTGFRSEAYNSAFVVPHLIEPWDYASGLVKFSNDSTSTYLHPTNGTQSMPNIKNPCFKDSPQQTRYCQLGSQMMNLGVQLGILFGLWQLLQLFFELVLPWLNRILQRRKEASVLRQQGLELQKNRRRFGGGDSSTGLSGAAAEECQAGSERKLQEYDNRTRYVKLVIQYAYVTMFANAFPAAACLALVNNICQTRVDAYKLAVQSRRIRAQSASGIGLYSKVMNLLCFTAIVINAALFGITSSSMGYLFENFGYKVGDDLTSVWRYVICSEGAQVQIVNSTISTVDDRLLSERHHLEFIQGVCLPLKNFHINNLNGFPPGEPPHEQTYTQLWVMVIVEHLILAILFIIEFTVPDASKTTVSERKGQAEWLAKRAAQMSAKVAIDPELVRGRFAHPELVNTLTDTRFIEQEIDAAKLESDFNPSTGFPKLAAKQDAADSVEGLRQGNEKVASDQIKLVTTQSQSAGPQNTKVISVEHGPEKKRKVLKPPTGKKGAQPR